MAFELVESGQERIYCVANGIVNAVLTYWAILHLLISYVVCSTILTKFMFQIDTDLLHDYFGLNAYKNNKERELRKAGMSPSVGRSLKAGNAECFLTVMAETSTDTYV